MVDIAINALFDPPRHFRDAAGSTVSVQTACELRPTGDIALRLQVHRLGGEGNARWRRTTDNRVAEAFATAGAFDRGRATCFCELWIRDASAIDATVDLVLEQLVVGVRDYLGQHEILGAVVESTGGGFPETSNHHRSYSFHVYAGGRRHHPVPRFDAHGASPGWLPYTPAQDPETAAPHDGKRRPAR
jgi:hypothetical protein